MIISIFTIIMTDKIAFLFLTRGEHNNVSLWEKFFETADPKKYKILVHPKEISLLKSSLWFHTNSSILRPIPTAWGSITLVKATLYLIQMALADPLVKKFVLLSESCIPTNHFNSVYETSMMEVGRSRIHWTFGKNIDRYTMIKSALPPTVTPHNWMKQSQWMMLDRKHVQLLFQANLQARCLQFLQHFQYCPVPDEHFFINYFIHILKLHPNEFINHPVTFVDWNSNSKHPKLFAFLPTEIIQLCRDNKIFFARKFAPLQLTLIDINYILDIKAPIVNPDVQSDSESEVEEPEEEEKEAQESEKTEEIDEPEEILLSLEQQAIVDYFSGTLKELKQSVLKLTLKQITSIHSTLFTKPPTLLLDSESDSESEETINQLEVIAEEPEDNLSEETDIVVPNVSLEKVESPNICVQEYSETVVKLEKEEDVLESIDTLEIKEEAFVEETVMESNLVSEMKEPVLEETEEVVLESKEANDELVLESKEANDEVVLESKEVDEEVVLESKEVNEEVVLESKEVNEEVVLEVKEVNEEVVLEVKEEVIVSPNISLEESDEVEIVEIKEEVEPKKLVQPKHQNMKKGKKGNY